MSPSPSSRGNLRQAQEVGLTGMLGAALALIDGQRAVRVYLAFESIQECASTRKTVSCCNARYVSDTVLALRPAAAMSASWRPAYVYSWIVRLWTSSRRSEALCGHGWVRTSDISLVRRALSH